VIRAVIEYWFDAGAKSVYLMENSTQANYTRIVFESNGYKKSAEILVPFPFTWMRKRQ
jgi:hypothetical protein